MGYEERPYTVQDALNRVVQTSTLVGTGPDNVYWFVTGPNYVKPVLLDSATTATGSATGTTTTGLAGFKQAYIFVDVTEGTGTSPTLNLFVDSRLDGTTYFNLARLGAITTGTINVMAILNKSQTTAAEVTGLASDAGAGTVRNIPWADDLRIRRTITGTSPSFSYRVWLHLTG